MAAVLEYGSTPAQPAAMYTFSAADSRRYDSPNMTSKEQPPSLDGACDRLRDNPFTKSKIGSLSLSKQPVPASEPLQPEKTASPPVNKQSGENMSNSDIDPNLSRRKRRKLTPTEHASVATIITQSNVDIREAMSDTHRIDEEVPDDGSVFQTLSNVGNSLSSQPVSKTPKRGRPRKKEVSPRIEMTQKSEPEVIDRSDIQSASPKVMKTTPTKKALSIHPNGKLLSSPKTRSPRTRKHPVATDQKTLSARNVKMKDGKFVQSLDIVLRYGQNDEDRKEVGNRIDNILSRSTGTGTGTGVVQRINTSEHATTHPFFLGKIKPKLQTDEQKSNMGNATDNESETASRKKEPIAWKDMKFSSRKPVVFKSSETLRPIWPPLPLQHVGINLMNRTQPVDGEERLKDAKLKTRVVQLSENENILLQFNRRIKQDTTANNSIRVPERIYSSGPEVALKFLPTSNTTSQHDAIKAAAFVLEFGTSAFDRGECAGPNIWSLQYAPTRWSEVLQPSAHMLHQWLQSLAVHNVKSGIDAKDSSKKLKSFLKKKRRKLRDELDDFIVNSDDDEGVGKGTKNAILITGPHGCGKTASVYAVAKELGVEVFEIHPGMRRSAKDIFDKVGDMAHNHLVQRGSDMSRNSSVAPSDGDTMVETDIENKQSSLTTLLKAKSATEASTTDGNGASHVVKAKREQKQSLILFEEVDLLFDDDKGFWSGVQSLISHSKRPLVLTCNDISSIPITDLDLFTVLNYEAVQPELATDYLLQVAAAEGHILDRQALSALYLSKGNDLRASITELNLWCQMTVGSKQGGLDWMAHSSNNQIEMENNGQRLRVFSKGTFHESLHILPQIMTDDEAAMRFNRDSLGIRASDWCDLESTVANIGLQRCNTTLQALSHMSNITEARSALDLLDDEASLSLALATATLSCGNQSIFSRQQVAARYTQQSSDCDLERKKIFKALEPVMVEKPTFPPSLGRLAPSLDVNTPSIATEIAPYIRHIVKFDARLEQHRDEVFGSQGKARKTRAARAAAEGGDKSSTRSERWFPKDLDFKMVMSTAGDWPEWYEHQERMLQVSEMASPCSSSGV